MKTTKTIYNCHRNIKWRNYTTCMSIAYKLIKNLWNKLKVSEQDTHFLMTVKKPILDGLKIVEKWWV